MELKNAYENGIRSPEIVSALLNLFPGVSEQDIYNNPELIAELLNAEERATKHNLDDQINAIDAINLVDKIGLAEGTYSLSDIVEHNNFVKLSPDEQSILRSMATHDSAEFEYKVAPVPKVSKPLYSSKFTYPSNIAQA